MDLEELIKWAFDSDKLPTTRSFRKKFEENHPLFLTGQSNFIDAMHIGYLFAKHKYNKKYSEYLVEWRSKNPEYSREYSRKYMSKAENAERKKQYQKEYYQKNKHKKNGGLR